MKNRKITYTIKNCPNCNKEFETCYKNKKKMFCSRECSKSKTYNPQWKGNNPGYKALHQWVIRQLTRPDSCSCCGNIGKVDLANISNEYKRDLKDWEWLCRRCHMQKDGRMKIFLSHSNMNNKLDNRYCKLCGKEFSPYNSKSKFCSKSCAATHTNLFNRDYSRKLKQLHK